MNYVVLMGRLTKDPEIKKTSSGKSYCRFSIAVKREFSKDAVDFINCIAWDKKAETIVNYFSKGHRILIQGRINTGSYEVNNEKRTSFDIVVDKIDFIESAQNSGKVSENIIEPEFDDIEEDDIEFPF